MLLELILVNYLDEEIGSAYNLEAHKKALLHRAFSIFIFNGALGIINYWVKNDFEQDIDYISNIIERLSYSGIKKFIYI